MNSWLPYILAAIAAVLCFAWLVREARRDMRKHEHDSAEIVKRMNEYRPRPRSDTQS